MDKTGMKNGHENDPRLQQARDWLQTQGANVQSDFHRIAGDASFRRYFRLSVDGESRILMDAPPPAESVGPFIDINRRLKSAHLHAPDIIHADRQSGFLLLEDLGDDLYRELLDEASADFHLPVLFDVLKNMALKVNAKQLPEYDEPMLRTELNLFPDWYLGCHREAMPRDRFDTIWNGFCKQIIHSALEQPRCFVHRDFHSCNLLKTADNQVGIIDFQDAVMGPVSYDFISLIWDRYINWPRAKIECWAEEFRKNLDIGISKEQWLRYCDLMGLQRNIKIVGIFARLHYRDGKSGYLEMIPRFYGYLTSTMRLYPEFSAMLGTLEHPECVP